MTKPFKHRITRLPKILTCARDFYQIDTFMRMVENDAVDELQGTIVMQTFEKEIYAVLPAMRGWMDFYSEIAQLQGIPYDDMPMRQMVNQLDALMPLRIELVQQAKQVVEAQRKLYLATPDHIINKVSRNMLESETT